VTAATSSAFSSDLICDPQFIQNDAFLFVALPHSGQKISSSCLSYIRGQRNGNKDLDLNNRKQF
jgi:hypothetical protein